MSKSGNPKLTVRSGVVPAQLEWPPESARIGTKTAPREIGTSGWFNACPLIKTIIPLNGCDTEYSGQDPSPRRHRI
jgi:hypothetical protein